MAEAMQQQAIAPIDMPTMPGVRVSPMQGFAKLLQSYIAGKNLRRADEEQKAYETSSQEDVARLLRNMGKTEIVPGDITSPAQEAKYEPPVPIQENLNRKQELVNLIAPDPTNAARAAIGYNLMRPEDRERITNLPSMTEGREIPAVPEERGPSRQVPYLSADLLDPNNPNAMKTGQGKQMLAQYLMQQEAQKQAAAQAQLAAQQQIHAFNPEQNVGRIVNGKYVPLIEGKPKELTDYQNYQLQLQNNANAIAAVNAQDKTGLTVSPEALQINPKIKGVPTFAKKTNRIDVKTKKPIYTFNGEDYIED
jgi:hypothetical protein